MSPPRASQESKRPPRESRKVREARKRRAEFRRTVLGLVVICILLVAAGAALIVLTTRPHNTRRSAASSPIDGIPCQIEQVTYHEHAHLDLIVKGNSIQLPTTVGQGTSGCLYWLHVHPGDASGLIHIEAPHRIVPTLGTFFDVWGQSLSSRQVWRYSLQSGQTMRVFVNQARYVGNPRQIPLKPHTAVTIEIGPPFRKPGKYKFESGY